MQFDYLLFNIFIGIYLFIHVLGQRKDVSQQMLNLYLTPLFESLTFLYLGQNHACILHGLSF